MQYSANRNMKPFQYLFPLPYLLTTLRFSISMEKSFSGKKLATMSFQTSRVKEFNPTVAEVK